MWRHCSSVFQFCFWEVQWYSDSRSPVCDSSHPEAFKFFSLFLDVLKFHHDIPQCGPFIIHSHECVVDPSNLQIHVLYFWEIFLKYLFELLPLNFLLLEFLVFQSWVSQTNSSSLLFYYLSFSYPYSIFLVFWS